jgi:hypothetical protein
MKLIPLTQGKFAQVDDEDYKLLMVHKWHYHQGYAYSGRHILMHRLIMKLDYGNKLQVDHRDRNGLNNQKNNLRCCTCCQNNGNSVSFRGTSQYKGVSWQNNRKKWVSFIKINKKNHFIGRFNNEEDAAHAYDKVALEYFGEFARLNIPN